MEIQSGFQNTAVSIPQKLYSNHELHQSLCKAIQTGRLCHAYLFYGAKGIGKKTFAFYFAASILCSSEPKPCRSCKSCTKAFSGNHPDIILYEGKRGASAIHIETIRQIRQDAYVLPNESEYKVYIIPNIEDMSPGAANAFLKILEEPPSHVIFLLTSDNPELVPETIRSRCVLQELYPMPCEELEEALIDLFPDKLPAEIRSASELANGILGRAIEILKSADSKEISDLSDRLTAGLAAGNEFEMLASIYAASNSKEKMHDLLEKVSYKLHEALLEKLSASSKISPDSISCRMTARQLESAFEALEKARAAINSNVNQGLLVNYLTVNLMKAIGLG